MRFVGIDIGSMRHAIAVVDEAGAVVQRAMPFGEEAARYQRLRALLGEPADCLVTIEATGHYWKNLASFLVAEGFAIALLNPIRTHRFAEEELQRTKTIKWMQSESRDSRRRSAWHLPNFRTREPKNYVSWYVCGT
jgi:transposase